MARQISVRSLRRLPGGRLHINGGLSNRNKGSSGASARSVGISTRCVTREHDIAIAIVGRSALG
jgi:hypothetical protein